jgi:hypothetical protein
MTAPTLIVGLGGIGSKIVSILYGKTDDEQKKRIRFVVFDTDVNDLYDIRRKNPHIHTVQTSTNMTVGNYLHYDKHTRDNSFPVNSNLNRKTLSEGAGQVRAISYLAFVTAMKNEKLEPLEKAINELYDLKFESSDQALRVMIVSTLAGGTGSGLILPVSMYIRNFLETRRQTPGNIARGFFILPEILYDAVSAEPMRNAFKANAYAVLRELNAFILKADKNLPKRYKNKVKLEFPISGTEEFEEYDVLPMDFCFMFDAQNIEGSQLKTTQQYLQHAATCIYAQAIGPMNTKSNSQEDNVIRTLVSGQSRNRYAGAGASELVYPSSHIQNYIALKWADQTITNTWTMFDKIFKDKNRENSRARLKGLPYDPDITQDKVYIETVDELSSKKEPNAFSVIVRRASFNFEKDGFTQRAGSKWESYIKVLNNYVESNAEKYENAIAKAKKEAETPIRELQGNDKTKLEENNTEKEKTETDEEIGIFSKAYDAVKYYRNLVKRRVDDMGRIASYTIFNFDDGSDVTLSNDDIRIEYHMKDEAGNFMHPNAIRYFLYQTLRTIRSKLIDNEKKKLDFEEYFDAFDKLFDDPKTPKKTETIGDFITEASKATLWDKITRKYGKKIKQKVEAYDALFNQVNEYWTIAPYVMVLKSARDHVEKLCKSFELFYSSFDSNIGEVQRQIKIAEDLYQWKDGNTIRYVCSTQKCLNRFYDKYEFTGNAIELPDDLCKKIYKKVRDYSAIPDNAKSDGYFRDLFENDIIKHFKDSVEKEYGMDFKMDVIRALEVEAEYEGDLQNNNDITEYVRRVIKATKKLADPFINRPIGEVSVPIPACAYNKDLKLKNNPVREMFVNEELNTFGGVECNDEDGVSTERIFFYSAIYGLMPDKLLKFSPRNKSQTGGPEAGEYYKAYWDMVNRMGPNPQDTKVITPHLHKHWHLISEMPALSNEEQIDYEKKIYKALILGFLYNMILCEKDDPKSQVNKKDNEKRKYKYVLDIKSLKKRIILEVSNGTECDTFFEVVDALSINPLLVNDILDAVDKEIETERKDNIVDFKKTTLSIGLDKLNLEEISDDGNKTSDDGNKTMSIFGIAIAYKVTMPPDEFIDEQGELLLETTLESLYEQLTKLCPEDERDCTFVKLIDRQLEIFKGNFGTYKKNYPSAMKDYLKGLLHTVTNFLYNKGFNEVSKIIKEYAETYEDTTQKKDSENTKKDS